MTEGTGKIVRTQQGDPPRERPIAPGEYGRALLKAYEEEFGPAIGADVAYAVERYAKGGGYFPPIDAGREGLQRMQGDFRNHLRRNAERFSEDLGQWLKKTPASFPALDISSEEATWRIRAAIAHHLVDVFDNAHRFHEDFVIPLSETLQHPTTLLTAIEALPIAKLVDTFYATNDKLHNSLNIKLDSLINSDIYVSISKNS